VSGQTIITNSNLTHTFTNGNKYVGGIKDSAIAAYVGAQDINKLATFEGLAWEWANLEQIALDGTVIYPDGKSEKVINGLTESEIARREAERLEAERLEAERKAKEEAERLEAERKAEEARLAEERKAQEEAARQEKLLAQKIAKLKKKYPAKFVDALAEDRFMEDMPYQLFVDFYGADALVIDYGS
jgi:flagellar biosynthesis GTPase FlhF